MKEFYCGKKTFFYEKHLFWNFESLGKSQQFLHKLAFKEIEFLTIFDRHFSINYSLVLFKYLIFCIGKNLIKNFSTVLQNYR